MSGIGGGDGRSKRSQQKPSAGVNSLSPRPPLGFYCLFLAHSLPRHPPVIKGGNFPLSSLVKRWQRGGGEGTEEGVLGGHLGAWFCNNVDTFSLTPFVSFQKMVALPPKPCILITSQTRTHTQTLIENRSAFHQNPLFASTIFYPPLFLLMLQQRASSQHTQVNPNRSWLTMSIDFWLRRSLGPDKNSCAEEEGSCQVNRMLQHGAEDGGRAAEGWRSRRPMTMRLTYQSSRLWWLWHQRQHFILFFNIYIGHIPPCLVIFIIKW